MCSRLSFEYSHSLRGELGIIPSPLQMSLRFFRLGRSRNKNKIPFFFTHLNIITKNNLNTTIFMIGEDLSKTFEEELPDLINDMHICDDEGLGCEIIQFTASNRKYYRCKLRRESLESILTAHQAEMDRVVEKVIGSTQGHQLYCDLARHWDNYDLVSCSCDTLPNNILEQRQRARYKATKEGE